MFATAILLAAIAVSNSQILQQFTLNPCSTKQTCHDCITTPSCAWCYDEKINTTKRCFQVSYQIPPLDQCDKKKIYNPPNKFKYIANATLSHRQKTTGGGGTKIEGVEISGEQSSSSSASGSTQQSGGGSASKKESIVQIQPQRVSLQLRARQTYSINMFYTQAEDYPVDLYYLMDLSKSMEDDKQKLSALGDHLASTMKKITKKFMLGFGSFVDKVVMPYVSTIPENLISPCPNCEGPYGFKHMMTLSQRTNMFSEMVNNASVSGNLDAPEGGFDAIMQAVVCQKRIGWRKQARRLLVFSTDAGFHYAGDGKLGGIVKPNDGKCHLDDDGYYEMSSLQDYPSISQINMYVKKHAINVIFAVTGEKLDIYKQLQQHVEGSSCGKLSNDSSNVVDLIIEQYQAISSNIEMKHDASAAINVKFFSKCLNPDGELVETNKCDNLKVGSLIEFKIQLEIIECPKNPKDWKQFITIKPVGSDESLVIELTMLCDCPCERPGNFKPNAPECHNKGNLMCGVCACESDAHGTFCECGKNNNATTNNANCMNNDTMLECSGRGNCVCGTCVCFQRTEPDEEIYGPTCDCDNFSCERHNGQICSGPDHGKCKCGSCECEEGWMGDNCACRNTTDSCIMPGEKDPTKVCSGNGICECGVCKCNVTEEGRYYGRFCEHCPNCSDDCNKYKECVQCQQYETGPLAPKDSKECQACTFTPIEAEKIVVDDKKGEVLCAFYDEDDCRYSFVYSYDESKNITIRAQKERECPAEVFLLGIVLGVIAVVVLLGLAILLLWKLFTTIHDRREFAKFEKEAMMARWDTGENPIYKQATSTFKNPTYAGKS